MLDNAASIALALDQGVDVINRRLFLHGDIDEAEIGMIQRGMLTMAAQSDEPIDLWVSSVGGDVDEAFGLVDVMRLVDVPIHTVAWGKCLSAAPMLVAAGKPGMRLATKNTWFMLHPMRAGMDEASSLDLRTYGDIMEQSMVRYVELLAEYSLMPKRFWSNIMRSRTDRYFTAAEAEDYGLVDHVV